MIIECPANVRLQNYLLSQGNCGKCRVKILKGKTTINTMDRIWFSEGQLEEGWRLGCQVYTKESTTVEL